MIAPSCSLISHPRTVGCTRRRSLNGFGTMNRDENVSNGYRPGTCIHKSGRRGHRDGPKSLGARIGKPEMWSTLLLWRCGSNRITSGRQSGNYLAWQLESRRPVRPHLREAHLLGTRPRLLGRRVRRKGRTGNHSIPRGGPSAGRAGPICGLECSRRAWPLLRGAVVRPRARGDRSYRL